MFGMGMGEIVLIAVVALLFLGPDRLPGAAKAIGKGIRDLRMQTKDLQQTIEKDTQIGDAVRELRGALRGDPETLYERATGQKFSTDKAKSDESKAKSDEGTGTSALADTSTVSESDLASAAPAEATDSADPGGDPDADSHEPVIRSAPGAVARSGEGGDDSSHG